AQAQETPGRRPTPRAAIAAAGPSEGRDLTVRRSGAERGEPTGAVGTPSWWLVAAGIGVALVGLGAASLGAGRWARLPGRSAGDLRVVGRLHLTTRHSIHLLRVGDRTLLVGTG